MSEFEESSVESKSEYELRDPTEVRKLAAANLMDQLWEDEWEFFKKHYGENVENDEWYQDFDTFQDNFHCCTAYGLWILSEDGVYNMKNMKELYVECCEWNKFEPEWKIR